MPIVSLLKWFMNYHPLGTRWKLLNNEFWGQNGSSSGLILWQYMMMLDLYDDSDDNFFMSYVSKLKLTWLDLDDKRYESPSHPSLF
jgi:hypothetical protein